MVLHPIEPGAQVAIERLLNSLPEGLLIAFFAWITLRLLPRQNSRTRFAVWFLALLTVATMPWFGGLAALRTSALPSEPTWMPAAISLPSHWATVFLSLWALTSSVMLIRLAVGLWNLHQLRQNCTPIPSTDLDSSLAAVIGELNNAGAPTSRQVIIATSDHIQVPAALGLWSPMIVLPSSLLHELPPSDLNIILRHEFAHLERWDDWTNLIQKFVRALLFFHPAVWWIENRLSIEREMACDDVVVAQTDNPTGYAACLISLLERSLTQRGWSMAQALVHRAREASIRLAEILDKNRPSAAQTAKPALSLIGGFALLCVIALPYTPKVVAFEQAPQSNAAHHDYSAKMAQPAMMGTSFVQPLVQRASYMASVSKQGVAASRKTAPIGRSSPTKSKSETMIASAKLTKDAPSAPPALRANAAASEEGALLPINVSANDQMHFLRPTLVFFQAQYVESGTDPSSDSQPHYTIWRVQVWRLTVFNPMWKYVPQVPVAHST
jgi:beta-lactamase regulating signal transducer with metallopeptidase domain